MPWKTAYASSELLAGDTTFVLGASGHIAGVINPAAKNKRNYWVDGSRRTRCGTLVGDGEQRAGKLVAAVERLARRSMPGARSPRARRWETASTGAIEPAPGRYVMTKAD